MSLRPSSRMPDPMKTRREIETESQYLMVLGRQYRDEQRQAGVSGVVVPFPRVLARLSEPLVIAQHDAGPETGRILIPRGERYIEAAIERDELVFRLMERGPDEPGADGIERDYAPAVVMSGRSAFDVLRAGYTLVEEERLAASLERYAGRSENRAETADGETVAEVEEMLVTNLLPVADRLRTKMEIAEFLEGRMEANVFIAHVVERQCARDGRRERLTERHELKLTIDEP